MTKADHYPEWQKLCEEHEAARDAYMTAFLAVNHKFQAIGAGRSRSNPTNDELGDFASTWRAWEDVKRRMDEFVTMHA